MHPLIVSFRMRMDLKEKVWERSGNRIYLAEDGDKERAHMNTVIKLRHSFLIRTLLHEVNRLYITNFSVNGSYL